MSYCMDTSALMDAWFRHYPPASFPSVWTHMEEAADNGVLISPDEVLNDLKRKDDDLHKWAKARPNMFLPLEGDVQLAVQEILARFPRLVDTRKGLSTSDPFVIALAKVRGTPVVTGEKGGTAEKPKIPSVCHHYGIDCLGLLQLIAQLGWVI